MFINKHLIHFAKGSEKNVCVVCLYELILVLTGTFISLCSAFAIRMILGESRILCFTHLPQLFLCIALGLMIRYIVSKRKVIAGTQCSNQIKEKLRRSLIEKLFDLGPAFTVTSRTGDIADTISSKVEWLTYYYTMYLPTSVSAIVNALILLLALAALDWLTALVCLIACVGMLGCPMVFYRLMQERGKEEWAAHASYYSDCLDSIQGMTSLKAFNASGQRRTYIHRKGEELRRCVMRQLRVSMLENGALEFLGRLGSAFSVAVAVVHSISGGADTANLVYVLFLAGACFTPMMNLVNAWHMGYRGVTASGSVTELLEQKAAVSLCRSQKEAVESQTSFAGDISYQDVCFAYNSDEGDVLHHVSLSVPNRTMTALVGPSGSGKSTLAHLLAGFYPVRAGSVRVGDLTVDEEHVTAVWSLISAVWQDSHIFYGSVMDNIRMGKAGATEEEVIAAARKANLHDFVMTLPEGYDTLLGENGMRFSGGERQRIALARAFLKDAPILLFDEATSSLDRKNEAEIQQSFSRLRQGKTALVIAHRLATIRQADQICIVDGGKITAYGTHEELAKTSEIYRALMGGQAMEQGR